MTTITATAPKIESTTKKNNNNNAVILAMKNSHKIEEKQIDWNESNIV